MRILLFLVAIITQLPVAFADNNNDANVTSNPSVGGMFPHFSTAAGSSAAPGTNQRLIGKVYLVYKDAGFVPFDSVIYSYNNGRGSVPNEENMNNDEHVLFDQATTYKFNNVNWGYENYQQRVQYFSGKRVSELIYKKWSSSANAYKNSERYVYVYDGNGKMQSSFLQLWYGTLWTNSVTSTLSYDNNNNVVNMNSTTYTVDFVYDGNNNLVRIEDKVWVQGTGWTASERKSYTYIGGNVSEYILEKWNNNTWVIESKWEYNYDTRDNVTESREFKWNNGIWVPIGKESFAYNQDDKLTEEVSMIWNGSSFVPQKKQVRTYNVKSLPETMHTQTWNGSAWTNTTGDEMIRYYYEQYNPASVIDQGQPNYTVTLSPIPASSNLNVDVRCDEGYRICMVDMAGRLVFDKTYSKYEQNTAIQVSGFAPGTYILRVQSPGFERSTLVSVLH